MAKKWPELALAFALMATSPFLLVIPINHDSYWAMWLARQMHHGVPLYSQLIEVNPPLWFWMAVPVEAIAEAIRIPPVRALIVLFLLALATCFWLTAQLADEHRSRLYLGAFVATVLLPLSSFTQREHFTLIASIPYVLLAAKRSRNERVPQWLAVTVGVFSAVGFALKPFFLIVPIVLAFWSRRIRVELILVGAFVPIYCIAIWQFAPAYISVIIPLASSAYGGFGRITPVIAVWTLLPIAFAAPLVAESGPMARASQVASLAFYLALLAQGKGWGYQALPAHGLLIIALALSPWGASSPRDVLAAASLALMAIPRAGLYRNSAADFLATRIDAPPGSTVAVLSESTMPAWPFVEQKNYRWPLRGMSLWMLHAAKVQPVLQAQVNSAVSEDLACNPPTLLIVDRSADLPIISRLREVRKVGPYRIMVPRSVVSRPQKCRQIY